MNSTNNFHCLILSEPNDSNYMFPVPKIENVYQAWKPIDYGHPLVDPTLHYAPPKLERVHIGPDPPEDDEDTGGRQVLCC